MRGLRAPSRAGATFLVLVALGCSSRPGPAPATELPVGDYEFEAQSAGIRGTIRILRDSAVVEPFEGYCEASRPPVFQYLGYRCIGQKYEPMQISLDRRNPLRASSWSARVAVQRQRQVCAQEGRNQQGQRVCLRYRTETYEEVRTIGGALTLRPAGP